MSLIRVSHLKSAVRCQLARVSQRVDRIDILVAPNGFDPRKAQGKAAGVPL